MHLWASASGGVHGGWVRGRDRSWRQAILKRNTHAHPHRWRGWLDFSFFSKDEWIQHEKSRGKEEPCCCCLRKKVRWRKEGKGRWSKEGEGEWRKVDKGRWKKWGEGRKKGRKEGERVKEGEGTEGRTLKERCRQIKIKTMLNCVEQFITFHLFGWSLNGLQ